MQIDSSDLRQAQVHLAQAWRVSTSCVPAIQEVTGTVPLLLVRNICT